MMRKLCPVEAERAEFGDAAKSNSSPRFCVLHKPLKTALRQQNNQVLDNGPHVGLVICVYQLLEARLRLPRPVVNMSKHGARCDRTRFSVFRPQHHLPGGLVRQPGRVPAAVGGLQLRLQHDHLRRTPVQRR